jgi:TATA-box binding protein (TBP) (component of TFIID and TFIIIB)
MDTFAYFKRIHAVRRALLEEHARPAPSWVRVNTITMCSKFLTEIDLPKFRENFVKLGSVTMRNKDSTGPGFEWTMRDSGFYNQVTIGYQDAYTRKSIKIFPNGSIQLAGGSDLYDCKRILQQLSFLLKVVLGTEENVPVDAPSIKMINTNFSLNASVNLNKIIAKLAKKPQFKVTFEPDRYAAVKVKFVPKEGQRQVTACIFSTGKIGVTGAQTLDEIVCAYEVLNREIDPTLMVKRVETPETFETIMGATFDEWVAVLAQHANKNM